MIRRVWGGETSNKSRARARVDNHKINQANKTRNQKEHTMDYLSFHIHCIHLSHHVHLELEFCSWDVDIADIVGRRLARIWDCNDDPDSAHRVVSESAYRACTANKVYVSNMKCRVGNQKIILIMYFWSWILVKWLWFDHCSRDFPWTWFFQA